MLTSKNPYNQNVIEEFQMHDDAAINQKVQTATNAFGGWKRTSFKERSALMTKLADVLRKNKEEYARIITMEMGKVISEAVGEIEKCAGACEYYAQHAEQLLSDQIIQTDAKKSYVHYQPIGAVLAVMPWNFPFWQVIRFAVPSIMAGNVGLLKHASNVSRVSLTLEKIFLDAGFPEGVFQSLLISSDKVESIIKADIVQAVTLTGSENAGSQVASIAGRNIKKSVMELGGSDPFIVLADADLVEAAKVATQSRMQNAGQSCIAAKRFIVDAKVKDEFLNLFLQNINALKQGDPLVEGTTTGPMAQLNLAENLEKQMKASIDAGAKLLTGGERNGCNFKPALLDNVKPGMPAFDEETFGPLAAVITAKDEKEAVILANTSRYGLGSSIWTNDIDRGARLASEIESGSVFVNSLMRSDVHLPFGGIKKSGYGRELSELGIKEFTNAKTVFVG
jgi:succinate-semialdehyde dehydrogenase / glutarate-semialdehyde dehydrogenase